MALLLRLRDLFATKVPVLVTEGDLVLWQWSYGAYRLSHCTPKPVKTKPRSPFGLRGVDYGRLRRAVYGNIDFMEKVSAASAS